MLQPSLTGLGAGMGETRSQAACGAREHLVWCRAVERRVRHHGVVLRQDRCPSQGPLGRFPDSRFPSQGPSGILDSYRATSFYRKEPKDPGSGSRRRSIAKSQKTLGQGHEGHEKTLGQGHEKTLGQGHAGAARRRW